MNTLTFPRNIFLRNSIKTINYCTQKAENICVVDYRSDTITMPTPEMRKVIFEAEVGDSVYEEDPSVKALEKKGAEIFGKEASLYVPSGTMGNLLAILTQCSKGSELILGNMSHIVTMEQAGAAQVAGVQPRTVTNKPDGTFCINEMLSCVRKHDVGISFLPQTSLVCIENTHNECGGRILPLDWVKELSCELKKLQIPLHMDAARIFNAQVKTGINVKDLVADCDTLSACLSKGLSAPVGSLLIGPKDFINKAKYFRKMLGGGARQIGFMAAAGYYALDNMVERLKDDHDHAKELAEAIVSLNSKTVKIDLNTVETNIIVVFINQDIVDSINFAKRLENVSKEESEAGIETVVKLRVLPWGSDRIRIVTNSNNTKEQLAAAIEKFKFVINEYETQ